MLKRIGELLPVLALALSIAACGQVAEEIALSAATPEPTVSESTAAEIPQATSPEAAGYDLREPGISNEPIYEYETRELYAYRGENQIYGVVYIPRAAGAQMPAIIYSHGYGGTWQIGAPYAKEMAARGYVVYCFDFCGGSYSSQSDGDVLDMSLFTEQADLEAVVDMLAQQEYVDSENIFLVGGSQGGAVSAMAGAARPEQIRGMVLLYPAFIMVDTANELFHSADEIPDSYQLMWMTVGRAYFEPLIGFDIYEYISVYDKDVLIIHGDADSIVPLSYSERALEVYPSARLEVISGAGHGFYGENEELAVDYITEYCNSHLSYSVD